MKELEALNKMLSVIFAYGPSKEKKKKKKRTANAKRLKVNRKLNA